MKYFKLKQSLFVFSALICLSLFSCKSSNYSESKQEAQADFPEDTIMSDDLKESHEDLMTVDYKQFYDELAPHGEWIEVTSADLKAASEQTNTEDQGVNEDYDELEEVLRDRSSAFQHMTLAQLFGINDAVAADVDMGAFFVWKPDPSMAVAVSVGNTVVEPEPVVVTPAPVIYRPYTNGQWIATDEGWYFKAPTPYEEIVHHYGRWAYSPAMGWVWIPGRVRAPAWVYWREDDDQIAWTPVPPDIYVVDNTIAPIPVVEQNYVIVEKRYFVEPVLYEHIVINPVRIKHMRRLDGIIIKDRVIVNRGPQFVEIERFSGRKIEPYQVVTINNDFKNTWIENNRINTFAPIFTKVKENKTIAVTQPEKFNKFQEVWNRENNRNNSAGNKLPEGLGRPNENKGNDTKENKQNFKKKLMDDSEMRTGKKRNDKVYRDNAPKREVKKEKIERPKKELKQRDVKKEITPKREDRQRKESPRKDRPRKDNPKKDNSVNERKNENPKGNNRVNHRDTPEREKKHR